MYKIYPITESDVYNYSLVFSGSIGLIFLIFLYFRNRLFPKSLFSSLKIFTVLSIISIIAGLKFRKSVFKIDYDAMVYEKTVDYFKLLKTNDFENLKLSQKFTTFLSANYNPTYAKDSLKQKCLRLSILYTSLLDDCIDFCSITSEPKLILSEKTNSIYHSLSFDINQKLLADSLILPLLREVNDENGEINVKIRMAKGFAELETLEEIKSGLTQTKNQANDFFNRVFSTKK